MRLTEVAAPAPLPDNVQSFAAHLEACGPADHFEAGRRCAREALSRLNPVATCEHNVARGAAGQPLWPAGIVGSITHTDDLAWAAVARVSDARSIGIDVERIRPDAQSDAVAQVVLVEAETRLQIPGFDPAARTALVLSIKESIFKCLFPVTGCRFYFDALEVVEVDAFNGIFRGVLLATLSVDFPAGALLSGRFAADASHVATAIVLGGTNGGGGL